MNRKRRKVGKESGKKCIQISKNGNAIEFSFDIFLPSPEQRCEIRSHRRKCSEYPFGRVAGVSARGAKFLIKFPAFSLKLCTYAGCGQWGARKNVFA